MSPICRYIFSAVLVLVATGPLYAQETTSPDTTVTVRKRERVPASAFRPTGLRIGTDLISIIKSASANSFNGWEINADMDFYRYYLAVDYGKWSRQETLTNGDYRNDGRYYRIGADVNFLTKDPDHNMFFIGFRYGSSSFEETVNYVYEDPVFGTVSRSIATAGLKGHWGEITTGLRVKFFSGFWMGCTARLKFAPGVTGSGAQQPYDIPGYGAAELAPYWGFNYQVFWRIPIAKSAKLPAEP